jgi:hypothetical protein
MMDCWMQEVVCELLYSSAFFMDPFPITEINKIVLIALLSTSMASHCWHESPMVSLLSKANAIKENNSNETL